MVLQWVRSLYRRPHRSVSWQGRCRRGTLGAKTETSNPYLIAPLGFGSFQSNEGWATGWDDGPKTGNSLETPRKTFTPTVGLSHWYLGDDLSMVSHCCVCYGAFPLRDVNDEASGSVKPPLSLTKGSQMTFTLKFCTGAYKNLI